jgi:hypothetical protein
MTTDPPDRDDEDDEAGTPPGLGAVGPQPDDEDAPEPNEPA